MEFSYFRRKIKAQKMYRISCVKYTNSLPFIYGIRNSEFTIKPELSLDTPADCYQKLLTDQVDIGLVPVVALRNMKEKYIISPYAIGADGAVRSVIMASVTELKNIEKIYLDYQSRTSVQLVRILARDYWKIEPEFLDTKPGFAEEKIPGNSAYVIIGDRAFDFHYKGLKIYDLAAAWKGLTGKPFVFATWVSNKPPDEKFKAEFTEALKKGIDSRAAIIEEIQPGFKENTVDLYEYFYHNIKYDFDSDSIEGMELFLNLLQE